MLSDRDIQESVLHNNIGIDPFDHTRLSPASYDVLLSPEVRLVPKRSHDGEIDCAEVQPGYSIPYTMGDQGHLMMPGDFLLASTVERICVPRNLVARIEGKSSLGRIGLAVHITAGFIDPGFEGQVTLEIANLSGRYVRLRPYMRIAQIAFSVMNSVPYTSYGQKGHYQNQTGPQESRFSMKTEEVTA